MLKLFSNFTRRAPPLFVRSVASAANKEITPNPVSKKQAQKPNVSSRPVLVKKRPFRELGWQEVRGSAKLCAEQRRFEDGVQLLAKYNPKYPEISSRALNIFLVSALAKCQTPDEAVELKGLVESAGFVVDWEMVVRTAEKQSETWASAMAIHIRVQTGGFPKTSWDCAPIRRTILAFGEKGQVEDALNLLLILRSTTPLNDDVAFASRLDNTVAKSAPEKLDLLWDFFRLNFPPELLCQVLDTRIMHQSNSNKVDVAFQFFSDHVSSNHRECPISGPTCGSLALNLIRTSRLDDASLVLDSAWKWGVSEHPSCIYAQALLCVVKGDLERGWETYESIPPPNRPSINTFFSHLSAILPGDGLSALRDSASKKGLLKDLEPRVLSSITASIARSYIAENKLEEGVKQLEGALSPTIWVGVLSAFVQQRRYSEFSRISELGIAKGVLQKENSEFQRLVAFYQLAQGNMEEALAAVPNLHKFFCFVLEHSESDILASKFLNFILEKSDPDLRGKAFQAFIGAAVEHRRADLAGTALLELPEDGSRVMPHPLAFDQVTKHMQDPVMILRLAEKFDQMGLAPAAARDFATRVVTAALRLGDKKMAHIRAKDYMRASATLPPAVLVQLDALRRI